MTISGKQRVIAKRAVKNSLHAHHRTIDFLLLWIRWACSILKNIFGEIQSTKNEE